MVPGPGTCYTRSMPSSTAEIVIRVADLSFGVAGQEILRGVTFKVRRGEYVVIVGPNGAGKSTLLRCLVRIHRRVTGTIEVHGRSLADYSQRDLARRIGYVPQAGGEVFPFTVEQFVTMGRYPYLSPFGSLSAEDRRAVHEAMRQTETLAFADRQLDTLSGGERQQVYIAAALAQGADTLLLDEPTTFLDYRHQADVARLLRTANREQGVTVVAVTHDLNHAALEADRVVALREGRVIFEGPPADVMRPEVLEDIYATQLTLFDHPTAGVPIVVPAV